MNFKSDNASGVSPEIIAALQSLGDGYASPYGDDELTERLNKRFIDIFENDQLSSFPIVSGTAANALSLSVMSPPYGSVYCHRHAHINTDECGAPEFFTGGAKLVALDGVEGKLHAPDLEKVLAEAGRGVVHRSQPSVVSLSQTTEHGTFYSCEEIAAIADVTHFYGCKLHMDGARFANAVVGSCESAANNSWKSGVDVLSFGASKNGVMSAEAVLFFDAELAESFPYRCKRAGHLVSKMRFLSIQLLAYLDDSLWIKNALHANAMTSSLYEGLAEVAGVNFVYPVQANEIFVILPNQVTVDLRENGFEFYDWPAGGEGCIRLVTSFMTKSEDVERFVDVACKA